MKISPQVYNYSSRVQSLKANKKPIQEMSFQGVDRPPYHYFREILEHCDDPTWIQNNQFHIRCAFAKFDIRTYEQDVQKKVNSKLGIGLNGSMKGSATESQVVGDCAFGRVSVIHESWVQAMLMGLESWVYEDANRLRQPWENAEDPKENKVKFHKFLDTLVDVYPEAFKGKEIALMYANRYYTDVLLKLATKYPEAIAEAFEGYKCLRSDLANQKYWYLITKNFLTDERKEFFDIMQQAYPKETSKIKTSLDENLAEYEYESRLAEKRAKNMTPDEQECAARRKLLAQHELLDWENPYQYAYNCRIDRCVKDMQEYEEREYRRKEKLHTGTAMRIYNDRYHSLK